MGIKLLEWINGKEKGKMKTIDPMSPVTELAFERPLKVPSSPSETELNLSHSGLCLSLSYRPSDFTVSLSFLLSAWED